jgi:small-conductance mechanosensitive channel
LPAGADRCPSCGAAVGEHVRCVHCRALVDVEPASDVRFVCRICGGVRIPIDDATIAKSAIQIELLKRASIARSASNIWRVVAGVVAVFGLGSVLVLLLVISVANPDTLAATMAGIAACIPFAFAALAFRKSRAHHGDIARLVDAAWMAAATDIARARGGAIDAATFARLTRASESAADQILARMSSQNVFTSTETPQGTLQYKLLDIAGEAPRLAGGS